MAANRLIPADNEYWIEDEIVIHQFTLPVGIHKSRLVKWVSPQLSLFENVDQ